MSLSQVGPNAHARAFLVMASHPSSSYAVDRAVQLIEARLRDQ